MAAQFYPFLFSVLMVMFLDDIRVPSFTREQLYVTIWLSAVGLFGPYLEVNKCGILKTGY